MESTRKTSLLHKIEPTARRSGFADIRELNPDGDSAPHTATPRVALGSISSSRCQITRVLRPKAEQRAELSFSRTSFVVRRLAGRRFGKSGPPPAALPQSLVEPDGIEPTTSCLQSRRSPN